MRVMETAFDPTYREAWNRRQVNDALLMPSTHALLVDKNGALIGNCGDGSTPDETAGFVLSRHAADEEELLLIAVLPQHRARGLGQALIDHLLEAASARSAATIFLEMRRGNPAIHLYRKVGFKPVGERRQYYRTSNGERIDAITFARTI